MASFINKDLRANALKESFKYSKLHLEFSDVINLCKLNGVRSAQVSNASEITPTGTINDENKSHRLSTLIQNNIADATREFKTKKSRAICLI